MLWLPRWFRIARGIYRAGEAAHDYLTHDEIDDVAIEGGFWIQSFFNEGGPNYPTYFQMDTVFSRHDDAEFFHSDYHY